MNQTIVNHQISLYKKIFNIKNNFLIKTDAGETKHTPLKIQRKRQFLETPSITRINFLL